MKRLVIIGRRRPNGSLIASLAAIDADDAMISKAVRDHRALVNVHQLTIEVQKAESNG
jgi:hypothetical protein